MRLYFTLLGLILLAHISSAQTLRGLLIDEYGIPIQEASIYDKNTDQHTHTDELGRFIFENVSIGDTIVFSHVSYESLEHVIEQTNDELKITMYTKTISLQGIVISPEEDIIQLVADIDIQTSPVNSSQDILRKVPGLFIGQHAGGGKAEQMFLRGFDIDHGTDVAVTVDGLPVNMVSHAHGQGYADLHFVIPETIDKVDFGKGPYYEDKGNFNTAGYVNFKTKKRLDHSSIKLEAGQYNTYRMLGMFDIADNQKTKAYLATEYLSSDGPFESSQNLARTNILGKYSSAITPSDRVGLTASYFSSTWDASGQIPERAISSGQISRFGAIDDTEGGSTSRTNLMIDYDKIIDKTSSIRSSVYLVHYDFQLFSNFTFFLEDPVNGDQIMQKEDRSIYGLSSEYLQSFEGENLSGSWRAGVSLRNDRSRGNELSHTLNRSRTLNQIQIGNIDETNMAAYIGATFDIGKWSLAPSVRLDYFDFRYNDDLISAYKTQEADKASLNPKVKINYNQSEQLQLYLRAGRGFHSNDTRVVVARDGKDILPAATGFDAGFVWKPTPSMLINTAYWYLHLQQEFVYVGDAGIVEPSGKTRRHGIELSYRYQPLSWLYYHLDANYTHARSTEEPEGQDYIPLAPDFTLVSGISVAPQRGLYGGINVRYLKDRPANEDNSIVAKGYTVTDLNVGYKWKKTSLGIQIQNLFDVNWNETQFATESRLMDETEPIEEIHFTPGTPFYLKAIVQYSF